MKLSRWRHRARAGWSATQGHPAPELFDAIAAEASRLGRLSNFKPQNLSNTVWAFATQGYPAPALFDAIAAEAAPRLGEFTSQGLANVAWAFATQTHAAPALFDAIAAEAAPRLGEFNEQNLANMAWAFATSEHAAPALFDAVAAEASRAGRLGEFKPQELANMAWAFATQGHPAPTMFGAIATEAAPRVREFNPQGLANLAWAFAVIDVRVPALFEAHAFVRQCEASTEEFSPANIRQLHQWQLWLKLEQRGPEWPLLPPALAEKCHAAFCEREGEPSDLQMQVTKTLRALGMEPREEHRTPSGYTIDAVVTHERLEVAIEVDGPSHFLGRSRTPTGATTIKRRQLRAEGWTLLPVPYWEWDSLNRGGDREAESNKRKEYLSAALSRISPQASRRGG